MLETLALFFFFRRKFKIPFSSLSYSWLDEKISSYEQRYGQLGWTLRVSFFLLIVLLLFTRLDVGCAYLGSHYAKLASDPLAFDSNNPCSYRILTPLISYLLGLRGKLIIITNLLITFVFIAVVFRYFRMIAPRAGDAFFAAAATIFTLVATTSVHCGGYTDIMTYLLIFLMWVLRDKTVLFYLLLILGLLNRESIVFLLPWFVFLQLRRDRSLKFRLSSVIVGLILTLGIYGGFRWWVSSVQNVQYSVTFYTSHFPERPFKIFNLTKYYQTLGLFSVFRILWVVPLLAVATWWQKRSYKPILEILLLILGAWLQLFIAFDTSRMMTMNFMIFFISLHFLFQADAARFRSWAFWLILANMLTPQVYTASNKIEVWQTITTYFFAKF